MSSLLSRRSTVKIVPRDPQYDPNGAASTAQTNAATNTTTRVAEHVAAPDPHGDRAYTDAGFTPLSYFDASGKLEPSRVPAIAISDYLGVVSNQTQMLALTGQRGDWCTRSDRSMDWQLIGEPAANIASWREMTYPASGVPSVNGRTGAVTGLAEQTSLTAHTSNASNPHSTTAAQVGLGNVNNTADSAKPISTATQTALDSKVGTARLITAGTGLTGGGNLTADRTLAVAYGAVAGTAAQGNDSRLSDARAWTLYSAPTAPTSGQVPTWNGTTYSPATPPSAAGGTTGPQGPPGLVWRDVWSTSVTYAISDAVSYNGAAYIAVASSVGVTPGTDATRWSLLAGGGAGAGGLSPVTTGEETIPRLLATSSGAGGGASGTMLVVYFTAAKTEAITRITTAVNNAASGLTLARYGIYSVGTGGALTALLASSANDTALWSSAFQGPNGINTTKTLSSTFNKVAGTRYAVAYLGVGTTVPTFVCANPGATDPATGALDPRLCARVASQTDLPASVVVGSLVNYGQVAYSVLLP